MKARPHRLTIVQAVSSAAVAILLSLGATAPASADFTDPAPISPNGTKAFNPEVAIDREGDALVVWQQTEGTINRIKARSRSKAGVFGPIQTLSAAGVDAIDPQVAIDFDGDALIAWRRVVSSDVSHVQARARSKTGVLGPLRTLANGLLQDLAVDADGDAMVVWMTAGKQIQARALGKDGVLGSVLTLSGPGARGARVVLEPRGAALFVWELAYFWDLAHLQARFRSRTGVLGAVETVHDSYINRNPEVAVDADGDALIVWGNYDEYNEWTSYVLSRARSRTGVYGPVQTVAAEYAVGGHQVAMDADGDAVVVWRSFEGKAGANEFIMGRSRSRTGVLSPIATLSAAGRDAFDPDVSIDADGDGMVVWKRTEGSAFRVSGRARSKTGAFGPGQTFSAAGAIENPQVAVDADGSAVVVWERGRRATQIEATAGP